MSQALAVGGATSATLGDVKRTSAKQREQKGQLWRFLLIAIITLVVITPILAVLFLSTQPGQNSTATGFTLENFQRVLGGTDVMIWLGNSLIVALVTVLVSVVIAAPAGYVLSRSRSTLVSGYSLVLFVVQALPVVTAAIPLFITFSVDGPHQHAPGRGDHLHRVDLSGAIWMMAAYIDSIPITLEEAAWMDGASVFSGFIHVVLRNSLPGNLSTAIFSFLLAWNDYLIALLFLQDFTKYTLPIGLNTFFQQNAADWGSVMAVAVIMMLPPVLIFALLNKYVSVGGIGGSLAGR